MSYLSDFEHAKLDAHVFPGCVVQKHYISSAISGQRRIPVTKVWKVEKLLGKGTFGEVRLEACSSENKDTNEERAVKRIWTTGMEFKRSYERELKALLEFSKPKYKESAVFVEFLGWFEDLESVYLAMEYLPLGDLEDNVLAVGGSIKETEVREIAVQVLEGLRIMHLENFAHRDLKPKVSRGRYVYRGLDQADLMVECASMPRSAELVGQACRLWIEQTSNGRDWISNSDWYVCIHGSGNPQLYP
jgi:Protein kinase domain